MTLSATRIYVLLALKARKAVILRRGPSKQTLLLKWHLDTDRLEYGQWFKGRIYERRCDLSPSGEYFLYFAAKFRPPLYSWTAISKPPYFTALALWPKGDCWGGGGIFETESTIQLNHRPAQSVLAEAFALKKGMNVSPCGDYSGGGEDFPINHYQLSKNGWDCIRKSNLPIYEKKSKGGLRLQMQFKAINTKNDAWYRLDYVVFKEDGEAYISLPKTDWADWDTDGDLLFARNGKLCRLNRKNFKRFLTHGDEALKEIANLNSLKFETNTTPKKATVW